MNPTEDTVATIDRAVHPRHYLIPKWFVWLIVFVVAAVLVHRVVDIINHLDWPPHDGRNLAVRNALNCKNRADYGVTTQMLRGEISNEYSKRIGVDRRAFIDIPECLAVGLYFYDEGTGVRREYGVYDMTIKRLTARIVITHEKFDHE